ncbi:MAG: hypothetical protein QOG49_1076 [Frankiaceae bacterium]|jgi:hypothetical protein|nr:hypothetical protein [Frankiaceae bacterium]
MAQDHGDGSRIEAAEAGVHAEQSELDEHGVADAHVDAAGSIPAGHGLHEDDEHDTHGGHGVDPNSGVVVAEPPTPAWVMTAVGIAAITVAVCVVLAVMLADKVG